jgi:hypothetical protein
MILLYIVDLIFKHVPNCFAIPPPPCFFYKKLHFNRIEKTNYPFQILGNVITLSSENTNLSSFVNVILTVKEKLQFV